MNKKYKICFGIVFVIIITVVIFNLPIRKSEIIHEFTPNTIQPDKTSINVVFYDTSTDSFKKLSVFSNSVVDFDLLKNQKGEPLTIDSKTLNQIDDLNHTLFMYSDNVLCAINLKNYNDDKEYFNTYKDIWLLIQDEENLGQYINYNDKKPRVYEIYDIQIFDNNNKTQYDNTAATISYGLAAKYITNKTSLINDIYCDNIRPCETLGKGMSIKDKKGKLISEKASIIKGNTFKPNDILKSFDGITYRFPNKLKGPSENSNFNGMLYYARFYKQDYQFVQEKRAMMGSKESNITVSNPVGVAFISVYYQN